MLAVGAWSARAESGHKAQPAAVTGDPVRRAGGHVQHIAVGEVGDGVAELFVAGPAEGDDAEFA